MSGCLSVQDLLNAFRDRNNCRQEEDTILSCLIPTKKVKRLLEEKKAKKGNQRDTGTSWQGNVIRVRRVVHNWQIQIQYYYFIKNIFCFSRLRAIQHQIHHSVVLGIDDHDGIHCHSTLLLN